LKEKRLFNRVLRKNNSIRRRLKYEILSTIVKQYHPDVLPTLDIVKENVMTDVSVIDTLPLTNSSPETKVYVSLLILTFLLDKGFNAQAAEFATTLVKFVQSFNRRTMDLLSAKVYFYYSRSFELINQLASIRNVLLLSHRTACLQHNEPGQAVLTNCIIRNYLHYNLYNLADKFRLRTTFLESRSNNQLARYSFYVGKIQCIQLKYSESYFNINQAILKAPQISAIGFRQIAHKFLCIVQLLMGEIPERAIFKQKDLQRSLIPYFQLTQAVRVGDLAKFNEVLNSFKTIFVRDKTYSLIVRLRHNVIKTGLRKISLSYSRISIKDICGKLAFDNEEDAEYMVAKAIADGVIDGVIDRKEHFMFSKENIDIYSTQEPERAFHKRIQFCIDTHNKAVKSLRFSENAFKQNESLSHSDDDHAEEVGSQL